METSVKKVKIGKVKTYERNPRYIKDSKFMALVKSIEDFPEMLALREIVVDEDLVILGGTMRYQALKHLGYTEIDVKVASGLTEEKKKEFRVKDNVSAGDWDYDVLSSDYDLEFLNSLELFIPNMEIIKDEYGDEFSLPSGDKAPFQQMTFTLADEQATILKNALTEIKQSQEYEYVENFGNENSNGNALYLLVKQWEELKK